MNICGEKNYFWMRTFEKKPMLRFQELIVLQGNVITYWFRRNRNVHLTKLFTYNYVSACALLWRFATARRFMFDRENCGSCVLEQLTTIPQQGKWSLKQELKTVLCILIVFWTLNDSALLYGMEDFSKNVILSHRLSFFKQKLRIFFSQWESCPDISWQPLFAVLLSFFLYLSFLSPHLESRW